MRRLSAMQPSTSRMRKPSIGEHTCFVCCMLQCSTLSNAHLVNVCVQTMNVCVLYVSKRLTCVCCMCVCCMCVC